MGDGELEVVDLTQDDDVMHIRHEASEPVDLSQLSSSDEDDDRERENQTASPARSARPIPAKTLYREGQGISKLLQMERELRKGLLKRQGSSATTTERPASPLTSMPSVGSTPLTTATIDAGGTASKEACAKRPRSTTTKSTGGTKPTASDKNQAAALRKIQKQFNSDKHVLKFIKVLLTPALMGGAVGLGIAQAFQQTTGKADHEHIAYEVSASSESLQPLVLWKRMVPSVENFGAFEEVMEPFAMLCLDAAALVELLQGGLAGLRAVLDDVFANCQQQRCEPEERVKVYILVYRLEQYITKREQQDHRQAVLGNRPAASSFQGEDVRQALLDLVVCHPHVEVFDSSSVEEASSHVVSITRAIAMRNCESQKCSSKSKYIAGKSRKQNGPGSTLNSLLLKDPLPEHATYAVRALTAIPSVTPQIAHALVKEYGSLRGIFEFLDDGAADLNAKKTSIENLRTFGGQRIGPVAAQKLVDFLFAEDPSTEI